MKNNNTKFEFKRRHIIYIIVGAILVSIVGAIIINEAYKVGTGYQTKWQASDMLIFFATIIEAIGTISLGARTSGISSLGRTKSARSFRQMRRSTKPCVRAVRRALTLTRLRTSISRAII